MVSHFSPILRNLVYIWPEFSFFKVGAAIRKSHPDILHVLYANLMSLHLTQPSSSTPYGRNDFLYNIESFIIQVKKESVKHVQVAHADSNKVKLKLSGIAISFHSYFVLSPQSSKSPDEAPRICLTLTGTHAVNSA